MPSGHPRLRSPTFTVANFQNNGKIWISCVDKAFLSNGKSTIRAKQWLVKCYSDSAPSKTTVKRWYADFKYGRTVTNDAERSGHPNSAVVLANIKKKLYKLVLTDRILKLREIEEEIKISVGSAFTILYEHLSMRWLSSKWVQRLLTVDQKQQRIDDSGRCLQLFQRNKLEFLRKYVTMDETWIHHFTPESNWYSSEWIAAGESRPSDHRRQHQQASFWPPYFGIRKVFRSSITLRKKEPWTANNI